MTQQHTPLRPALTAIAAVLALSSTAAFAQDVPAADPSAPMIAAPPPPIVSAPTVEQAVEPAAPMVSTPSAAIVSEEVSAPAPAQAVTTMATRSTPVIHTPEAAMQTAGNAQSAAPVERTARTATVLRTTTTRTASTTPPVKAAATPAPAPAPVLRPATAPAEGTTATTRTTTMQTDGDNTLPIAGGIALGLIALGGGIYALSRRRREDEDEMTVATEPTEGTIVTTSDVPAYAVATEAVTAVPAAPVYARTADDGDEVMTLANGYDLSRYGRHTRAAYRGPTPENPSHSLRKRLHHASFYDQREREAAERGELIPETPALAARATAAEDNDQIVIRPGKARKSGFFGTAFQR